MRDESVFVIMVFFAMLDAACVDDDSGCVLLMGTILEALVLYELMSAIVDIIDASPRV